MCQIRHVAQDRIALEVRAGLFDPEVAKRLLMPSIKKSRPSQLKVGWSSVGRRGAAPETPPSGALLRRNSGEGRPALLDFLTAAAWAQNFTFFVFHQRQNLVEEFLAFLAEELVVGHADLPQF